MRFHQAWLSISLAVLVTLVIDVDAITAPRRAELREEVREVRLCFVLEETGLLTGCRCSYMAIMGI
jgi:hypothetical protein